MIIDSDFLSETEVSDLQDLMYKDPARRFPWFFFAHGSRDMGDSRVLKNSSFNDHFQFVHLAQVGQDVYSPFAENARTVLEKFAKKHGIEVLSILKIKANLITNDNRDRPDSNLPHVDNVGNIPHQASDGEHYVLLYYVNDSDGSTVMFNETFNGMLPESLTLKEKISPVAGKAVFFPGDQYHSSSSPRASDFRCVININFIGKTL